MNVPFEPFTSYLNKGQISLLVDTVSYFEEAPKYLSLPNEQGERVGVPLLAETLRSMLMAVEQDPSTEDHPFLFSFEWTDEKALEGVLTVVMPNGQSVRQSTQLQTFSTL